MSAGTLSTLAAALVLAAAPVRADIPVVELRGVVHAVSAAHVLAAVGTADAQGAPLLVLRVDTPGGLDTSMRQIVERLLNCRTPVAVFVGPSGARAASAGFVIALAADLVAMAPGTNMGAAHPVSAMGSMDEVMAKKVASDAAAYVRSIAARRGRNVEMAEKGVLESRSFTDREALDLHLADLVVKDVDELVRALEGRVVKRFDGSSVTLALRGQRTVAVAMNWRQAILAAVARPEIMFLLLLGALAGIGAELSHPGMLLPGIVGVFCLILFLFAMQVIPINSAGVLLVLLAVALFAAEVKVTSYGLLTVAGLAAMILGAMMLVDAPIRIGWSLLVLPALAMAAGTFLLVRLVLQAQRRRPVTGVAGMMGARGTADTDLSPEGWVLVAGERWQGVAEAPVAAGEAVQVTAVEGLRVRVRKAEEAR
ncbi:MAG TPA: nodulation protein NfeD [Vicinamibacteria bacterium]|nr:nodulation protein NfeD [Vicinamibacteria bacterium]